MSERTISANEAKQRWGTVMRTVADGRDAVVVESHGRPRVAVISIERYRQMQDLELQRKRDIGLRAIREIEASYDGRNDDLSEEEVMELAVRYTKETRTDLYSRLGLDNLVDDDKG